MKIPNYDVKDDFSSNYKQKVSFMPDRCFRMLICAPSGCGKTNLLLDMIYRLVYYDKIYLYAKNLQQNKYQHLIKLFEPISALDQHPGLTIVMGGDTNHLDVNELCQLTGWNSLVDFPTRGVAYLDNVLTNRPDLFGKCAPFSISIKTDHTAVILPAGSKLKPVRQKVRIRDCRKHRKEALYLELAGETWDSVLETNDVEEAVNNLETLIHSHMDRCMPFRTVSISSRDPAWMTPLLKSLLRSKSRFGQYSGDRLREINRRISEVISENIRRIVNIANMYVLS